MSCHTKKLGHFWKLKNSLSNRESLIDVISSLAAPYHYQGPRPECTTVLAGGRSIRAFASSSNPLAPQNLELWSDAPNVSYVRSWEKAEEEPNLRIEEFEVCMEEFSLLVESFDDKELVPYPRATLCLPAALCNDFCLLLASNKKSNFLQLKERFREQLDFLIPETQSFSHAEHLTHALH